MKRLHNSQIPGKQVKISGSATVPYVDFLGKKLYVLSTAVTSGVTTDPVGASTGDFVLTTHATGRNSWFRSDGTNLIVIGDGGSGFSQGVAVADPAAPTAANPSAPTAYTPHVSGVVPVTSNAATDLDTAAAALKTLRDEVAALELVVSALVVDRAADRTAIINLLNSLEGGAIIAT